MSALVLPVSLSKVIGSELTSRLIHVGPDFLSMSSMRVLRIAGATRSGPADWPGGCEKGVGGRLLLHNL